MAADCFEGAIKERVVSSVDLPVVPQASSNLIPCKQCSGVVSLAGRFPATALKLQVEVFRCNTCCRISLTGQ